MTFEEEFSEAYQNWEIERLYLDLANALGKDLSPNAKIFLRGVLCANSPNEIAKKLNYQSKNISDTVRQTLSKEVYPAIEKLVNSGNKINWRKTSENSVSQLLKDYRKKPENSPPTPTEIKINWREVCAKMLEKQQTTQQLRRKATQIGCEVEVFVELGLVERKLQQRHSDNNGMEKFREKEVITRTYEYDEFLRDVIQGKKNKFTAIVGEAGSGKTTWLDKIATYLKNTNDLYICIPLGELQGKTLEEYILKKWLLNAVLLIDLDIDPETLEKPLTKLLQKDEVWLLLDGVDEIGESSAAKTLRNIQQQLTGLLSAARVVLTCRTNLWDINFNNPLSGFETYKTLEFKFEQVDDFIHQWFAKAENEKRGEKLEEKLKESRHERIYDLVINPLRLSLLCQIFYFDENAELPETKAGLYQQFIRYFYEWKPEKMDIDLNIQPNLKNELHQALGRVALAGLDSSERFRLSESLISQEIQDDKLFNLALDLDLLVLVDEKFKTDKVYTFFHRTFQEYFASLVIPNWEFLFNHIPGDVSNSTYRIFDSYWQEVALMWMESNSCSAADGEKFFNIFDDFESDKCLEFYSFQIFPFIVAALYRLGDYYQCQDILKKSIFYLIYHIDFNAGLNKFIPFCFDSLFFEILKVFPNQTSKLLNYCLNSQKYQNKHFEITEILFEICPNKEAVLDKVAEFLQSDNSIALEAAEIILKYDKFNPQATSRLVELFLSNKDENKCLYIIRVLLDNKSINQEIISEDVLRKLLSFLFSEDYNIRFLTSIQLNELSDFGVIDFDNDDEFIEILSSTLDEEKTTMVIFNILKLLEKLKVDNKIDVQILLKLIYPEQEHIVINKALELLKKRDISSEIINYMICLYLSANEIVEIKVFLLLDFVKLYSILNPQK
ncbi:MAG: NACHT domain-containing protein, partial [Trichodesmium sp. MO_231.B1]|nr:NACHT domain-containing protein [Trichodesmium sp. MO_231.B1]